MPNLGKLASNFGPFFLLDMIVYFQLRAKTMVFAGLKALFLIRVGHGQI
jgi:hypothetical protein